MNNLGLMYDRGRGVERDHAQEVSWFRKSAEAGDAAGTFRLGKMYEYGIGVGKDNAQAQNWYRKAASAGPCGHEEMS